jgi:hypothetical protein
MIGVLCQLKKEGLLVRWFDRSYIAGDLRRVVPVVVCAVFIPYRCASQLMGFDVIQTSHIDAKEVAAHDGFGGADESVDPANFAEGVIDSARSKAVMAQVLFTLKQVEGL